jgi:hypothetical protein
MFKIPFLSSPVFFSVFFRTHVFEEKSRKDEKKKKSNLLAGSFSQTASGPLGLRFCVCDSNVWKSSLLWAASVETDELPGAIPASIYTSGYSYADIATAQIFLLCATRSCAELRRSLRVFACFPVRLETALLVDCSNGILDRLVVEKYAMDFAQSSHEKKCQTTSPHIRNEEQLVPLLHANDNIHVRTVSTLRVRTWFGVQNEKSAQRKYQKCAKKVRKENKEDA